jgi:protease IV
MKKLLLCSFLIASPLYSLQSIKTIFTSSSAVKKPKVQMIQIYNKQDHKKIYQKLYEVGKNKEIDIIILMIDHCGGWTKDFCQLSDIVQKIQETKPVIAFIQGEATSAGYYVACATDYIIAHSKSNIGHIGTFYPVQKNFDLENKAENGLNAKRTTIEFITAGKYKTALKYDSGELTTDERKYIEQYVHDIYDVSLNMVVKHRNLKLEDAHIWADGQMFLAPRALKLGMIDKIGTVFDLEKIVLDLLKKRYPDKKFVEEIELIFPKEEDKDKKEDDCKKK